jgi:hypothetical protein
MFLAHVPWKQVFLLLCFLVSARSQPRFGVSALERTNLAPKGLNGSFQDARFTTLRRAALPAPGMPGRVGTLPHGA